MTMTKASDILPDNEWWDELDRQRAATGGGKEELCLEIIEIMEGGPMSAKKTCQRRSKNASAGRSKNTSAMVVRRPPNWGPSSDIRLGLGRDYLPVCPSWHGVSGSCSD